MAVLLIGEVLTYSGGDGYGAEVSRTSDGIQWTATASGTNTYNVLAFDNGTFSASETIYFYLDESFGHTSQQGNLPVGSKELTPEYYLQQLEKELDYRGAPTVKYVDADGLADVLSAVSNASKTSLVMVSGSVPDTVYGDSNILLDWIHNGGTLYWAGGPIGTKLSHRDRTAEDVPDGTKIFLGSDCSNKEKRDGNNAGMVDERVDGGLSEHLGLRSNCVLYGIDSSLLEQDGYLSLGYTDGVYSSITLIRSGMGQICIFGGDLTNYQRYDMSQIIASGICWCSNEIGYAAGTVSGSRSGSIELICEENLRAYLYLGHGEDFPVYGRGFDL